MLVLPRQGNPFREVVPSSRVASPPRSLTDQQISRDQTSNDRDIATLRCLSIAMFKHDVSHGGRPTHIPMWIIAISILLWQAGAAYAGPVEDCAQAQDLDRRILGCTDRVSKFPTDATAYFNRSSA